MWRIPPAVPPPRRVEPITPDEVSGNKNFIPTIVIECFNILIQKNWNGAQSSFKQDDAIRLIVSRSSITSDDLFVKKYLNIEELYRSSGWEVEYDNPGFNESYPATFTFRKKK